MQILGYVTTANFASVSIKTHELLDKLYQGKEVEQPNKISISQNNLKSRIPLSIT